MAEPPGPHHALHALPGKKDIRPHPLCGVPLLARIEPLDNVRLHAAGFGRLEPTGKWHGSHVSSIWLEGMSPTKADGLTRPIIGAVAGDQG
jgi:hypothetical protein